MLVHMMQLGAQGGFGESAMPTMPMLPGGAGPAEQNGFNGVPLLPGLGGMFDSPFNQEADPFAMMFMGMQGPSSPTGGFFGPMFGGPASPRGPMLDPMQLGGMGLVPNGGPAPFQQQPMNMDYGYQSGPQGFPAYQNQMSAGGYGPQGFDQLQGPMFPNPAMPPMGMNNPQQPFGFPGNNFDTTNMMPYGQQMPGFPAGPQFGMQPQYGNQQSPFM